MRKDFRKAKTKHNILDEAEIAMLKNVAKHDPIDRFLFWVLLYTGLRISEFVHMRRDWIDWKRDLIVIPESQKCVTHCREKGGVWKPKTKLSARAVPIVPEVKGVLRDFFKKHRSVMEVIPSRGVAYYSLRYLAREAGIKHKVFPHALRGTFATILASKDFNPYEIKDIMGWSSAKTADDYIRLSARRVKKAVEEKW